MPCPSLWLSRLRLVLLLLCSLTSGGAIQSNQPNFGGKKFEYHDQYTYQTTVLPRILAVSSQFLGLPSYSRTHTRTAHHVPHTAATDAQAGIGPGPARIVRQHHQLQHQLKRQLQCCSEESALGAGAASRLLPRRPQPDERRWIRHCVDRLHEADAGQAQCHGCG